MRINITMDEELVKKIDEVASKMYVSRSAYISFAVSQKIQADKMLDNLPDLLQTMKSMQQLQTMKSMQQSAKDNQDNSD